MKWLTKRINARRNRLTTEVAELGGMKFRLTRQRRKIIGLEVWTGSTEDGAYGYTVWKGEVR